METWELDFEWLQIRHRVRDALNKDVLPDMNAVLILIGIQELGFWKKVFTKEEKQDLMHIAICQLLSDDGYYEFIGRDADGWPHYKLVRAYGKAGEGAQEEFLKEKIIAYFREIDQNTAMPPEA
jgi:hypothetical protein